MSVVICSYENTKLDQGIFGGNPIAGELPVSVEELFGKGGGIRRQKTRLAYSISEEVWMDSQRLSNIDKIVQEGLDPKVFSCCQVFIAKEGVVIYNKAFGNKIR